MNNISEEIKQYKQYIEKGAKFLLHSSLFIYLRR